MILAIRYLMRNKALLFTNQAFTAKPSRTIHFRTDSAQLPLAPLRHIEMSASNEPSTRRQHEIQDARQLFDQPLLVLRDLFSTRASIGIKMSRRHSPSERSRTGGNEFDAKTNLAGTTQLSVSRYFLSQSTGEPSESCFRHPSWILSNSCTSHATLTRQPRRAAVWNLLPNRSNGIADTELSPTR